ncbi:MAG: extracellular solute-binding protein [Nocardioides sp.]|uniref:ABC transporter substrate-binding protein n=1 Tax=Nocardioides sp. TaxID=35761 RepID=UPI0039E2CFBC
MNHSSLTRRSVLRVGTGGLLALGAGNLFTACGSGGGGSSSSTSTTVGSNYSDSAPKTAFAGVIKAWQKKSGDTADVNTVSHNDFQENINSYLQGNPDHVFTWFSGYRMKYYAKQGLIAPVDDVWDSISDNFSTSVAKASTGDDGKKYLVPWVTYPWAVFYRKATFKKYGYEVPTTWDQYIALAKQMKSDGLIPIAFADADAWPALGTFDYLNMRLNGYDFHVELMAHEQSWDQQKVKNVFDTWSEAMPYHQSGSLGRKWEDAANAIGNQTAGMYVIGSDQIVAQVTGAAGDDLDFFPFPQLAEENGQGAVEAPIDGFMLAKSGADDKVAVNLLEYLGTGAAQMTYLGSNTADVATAKDADTSSYTTMQTKATKFINDAKQLSQFLDRDSLPTFASNVMEPAIQTFIKSGEFDTAAVEAQAKQLFDS